MQRPSIPEPYTTRLHTGYLRLQAPPCRLASVLTTCRECKSALCVASICVTTAVGRAGAGPSEGQDKSDGHSPGRDPLFLNVGTPRAPAHLSSIFYRYCLHLKSSFKYRFGISFLSLDANVIQNGLVKSGHVHLSVRLFFNVICLKSLICETRHEVTC